MQIAAIAQAGIAKALQRFEASAQRTAQLNNPAAHVDYAHEAVEQVTARHEFSANLLVLKTADDMLGRLLDLKA